jgi:hypothetical protein
LRVYYKIYIFSWIYYKRISNVSRILNYLYNNRVCGLVTWLVKNKFQPEIERDIQEREQKTLKYAREIRKSP